MNRILFLLLVLLTPALTVAKGVKIPPRNVKVESLHQKCESVADCTIVETLCDICTCQRTPVNRKFVEDYGRRLRTLCPEPPTAACEIECAAPKLACEAGRCVLNR